MRSLPNRSHVIRPRQAPVRPLAPSPLGFVSEALQRCGVPGDSVAGTVASQLAAQRRVLVSHTPMTMRPAPLARRLQRPAQAVPRFKHSEPAPAGSKPGAGLGGLALHHPSPLPGASPIVGEPQRREAAPAPCASTRALVRAASVHPPGLVRVQAQSVPLHPPRPHLRQVRLQVRLVVRRPHPVHTRRRILAHPPVRLAHPLRIDGVCRRRQHHPPIQALGGRPRLPPGQLPSLALSR